MRRLDDDVHAKEPLPETFTGKVFIFKYWFIQGAAKEKCSDMTMRNIFEENPTTPPC